MNYPKWEKVAPGVYAFIQYGVNNANSGLIMREQGAILVDTVINEATANRLISKIKEVTDQPVRFIINTHCHTDHVCTNHLFPKATTICSLTTMEEMKKKELTAMEEDFRLLPNFDFKGSKYIIPELAFEKSLSLFKYEKEIRAIDMGSGHSVSDTIVYLPEEKVVFCGDLLLRGLPPSSLEGSLSNYLKILEYLIGLDVIIYITGHGPIGDKDLVRDTYEYLVLVRNEAEKCFSKGISCEEACKTINVGRFKKIRYLTGPVNLAFSVTRAYAEFRGEEPCYPIDINWDIDLNQLGDGDGSEY